MQTKQNNPLANQAKKQRTNSKALPQHQKGFTMLELLLAMAIIAILGSVVALNGRNILQGSEEESGVKAIQQSFWQGATAAASRGTIVTLNRSGNTLTLEKESTGETLRTFNFPKGVTTNLPQGEILTFLPPGELEEQSYLDLPSPITVGTSKNKYELLVTIIGEVKVIQEQEVQQ